MRYMTKRLTYAAFIAGVVVCVMLASCHRGAATRQVTKQVVVLGFDGSDPKLASKWMAEGNNDIRTRFGYCLVIDCHSMPSAGQGRRAGGRAVDFVLGDLHGSACASRVTWPPKSAHQQGLSGASQRSLCRRLHYPPLRPAGRGRPCPADRDRSRSLHGRSPDRASARLRDSAEQTDRLVEALTLQVHDLIG